MSNFWTRTITGLSMAFVLFLAMAVNYWLFASAFLIITILGLWEFYSLFTTREIHPQRIYGTAGGALWYLTIVILNRLEIPTLILPPLRILFILTVPLLFLPFLIEIYRKKPNPLVNVSVTITGILYIALPLALMSVLNGREAIRLWHFPAILAGLFVLTWFYDTGAYLYGMLFGKRKFFERISPQKTWEGTLAGVIIALLTAVGLHYLVPDIGLADWLVFAVLIIVFGTFGDLAESLFKRSLNLKDSGSILPGHGGILDRFDTLFMSVPFIFLYLVIRNLI